MSDYETISIDKIIQDYIEYWGKHKITPPAVTVPDHQEIITTASVMREGKRPNNRSYTDALGEIRAILSEVSRNLESNKCNIITIPHSQFHYCDNYSLPYSPEKFQQITNDTDELYQKYLTDDIMAFGADFDRQFKEDTGFKTRVSMVQVKTPGNDFAFYQAGTLPKAPSDTTIEPFFKMNRTLKLKTKNKTLNVLFLSCGDVFNDRYQKNYSTDITIDMLHGAIPKSVRDAELQDQNQFANHIFGTLADGRKTTALATFPSVPANGKLGQYTIANRPPERSWFDYNDETFRLEYYNHPL